MKRIALDANAHDFIVENPGLHDQLLKAVAGGRVELIRSVVQIRQIEEIPKEDKLETRQASLALPANLKSVAFSFDIPEAGLDEAEWATTQQAAQIVVIQGNSPEDSNHKKLFEKKFKKKYKDALIAVSANDTADVFVTGDQDLRRKCKTARNQNLGFSVRVWSLPMLARYIRLISR